MLNTLLIGRKFVPWSYSGITIDVANAAVRTVLYRIISSRCLEAVPIIRIISGLCAQIVILINILISGDSGINGTGRRELKIIGIVKSFLDPYLVFALIFSWPDCTFPRPPECSSIPHRPSCSSFSCEVSPSRVSARQLCP